MAINNTPLSPRELVSTFYLFLKWFHPNDAREGGSSIIKNYLADCVPERNNPNAKYEMDLNSQPQEAKIVKNSYFGLTE